MNIPELNRMFVTYSICSQTNRFFKITSDELCLSFLPVFIDALIIKNSWLGWEGSTEVKA